MSYPNPLLQAVYDGILATVPPYLVTHPLFLSVVALASFHINCALFTLYDVYQGRAGVREMLRNCALPQIVIHLVVNSLSFLLLKFDPVELPREAPTTLEFVRDLALCYLVGDFLIYWEHRWMHKVSFLRTHIHSTHHTFTSPMFSYAAGYVHPVEIAVAIACELAYPTLFDVHPLTVWIFVYSWVFLLTEEHSGNHVWWSLYSLLPWQTGGGSKPHDLHHAPYTTKNFSFVLALWDRLFGTFESPEDYVVGGGTKRKKVV